MTELLLYAFAGIALGITGGYFYRKNTVEKKNKEAAENTAKLIAESEAKSKEILLKAERESFEIMTKAKKEEDVERLKLEEARERLQEKEETIDKKITDADKMREDLEGRVAALKELKAQVQELYDLQKSELEKIAGLSREEAKELLLKRAEEEYRGEIVQELKKVEEEEKKQAKDRAKTIIADAIQRYASDVASESTATIVDLPSDDMKGRIIGREGRNINTFEQITGIDVIVDDTPGSIVISGFDLIRRYIAKVALERLITDGRIHPARIEETVEKVKGEVNELIRELGEKAVFETGVVGLSPNLIKLLGRLKFRVSYGQNVLKNSIEVSFLAAALASELGADINVCRTAGLLHDIGKAVDHEISGHHSQIGRDILKKFGLQKEVVHAVEASDGLVEPETIEAICVQAANIISRSRPGANKENLDTYIKRMDEIENLVRTFNGVKQAFAIQAGNEVRVIVDPEKINDLEMMKMARDVSKKIATDLNYPGGIKVHLLRETRGEAYAT